MPIQELASLLLDRQMQENPSQFGPPKPFNLGLPQGGPEMKPINPELTALIGGAADAATTYRFLKNGTGHEDNALFKGAGGSPLATAGSVMGTALAMKGARHLMRNHGMDKLADVLAGTQGNAQIGVAANNLNLSPRSEGSMQAYDRQLHTALAGTRR